MTLLFKEFDKGTLYGKNEFTLHDVRQIKHQELYLICDNGVAKNCVASCAHLSIVMETNLRLFGAKCLNRFGKMWNIRLAF